MGERCSRFVKRMLATCAASGLVWSAGVQAQVEAAPSVGPAARPGIVSDGEPVHSEIIVTAQRRSELQRDVPISITSIDADALRTANVVALPDIQQVTPALRFDYVGAFAQPTIRGVGTSLATSGSGANVGIYIDGFYSPNPVAANLQLMNVESIQVLKGPQGTLFGRNTTGGAILISTGAPSQETRLVAEASYARFDTQRYQAYGTTGLTDTVAVDLEGLYTRGDGFQRSVVTGSSTLGRFENWAVRAGLSFEPSDRLSFLLRYKHERIDDPSTTITNAYKQDGRPLTIGVIVPGAINPTDPDLYGVDERIGFRFNSDAVQLTATLKLDGATLTSYTQYRHDRSRTTQDLDQSAAPVFDIVVPIDDKTITQEFLLSSAGDGPLEWTAGMFFFDYSDQWRNSAISVSNSPFMVFANSGTVTRSYAAFADVTYSLTEDIFLTGGLRYSYDEVRDAFFVNYLNPPLGRFDIPTLSSERVTPRFVLRYTPDASSSVYASYAQGYKAPILNVGAGQLTDIKVAEEKITSYEVGYKTDTGPLSLALAAFYYDYKNLQVSSYRGTSAFINNAASSRIYGVEGEIRYRVGRSVELNAGGAYTDAQFRTYRDAPSYVQCLDPAACGAETGQFLIVPIDASGFKMQRAPEFTGNVGARWTIENVGGGELALSGNLYYSSSFFFDPANQFSQDAYERLSLRAAWTDPSERFTLAAFGDNVTGERYRTQAFAGQFGVGSSWSAPAVFGVEVRVDY